MWLSIELSMGAEPAEDGEDAEPEVVGAEPDEDRIIWGVEVARPRLLLLPPLIGMTGTVTSSARSRPRRAASWSRPPLMEIWRDALASEVAWDPDYAPAGPGIDGDIAREVIALTTGADPITLSEHPLLGRLGDNGLPDPDQEMLTVRYHAMLYGLSAITPPVLAARFTEPAPHRSQPAPRPGRTGRRGTG